MVGGRGGALAALAISAGCHPAGGWLEAWDDAIAELRTDYAFTEHKQLDWAAIDAAIRPAVADAADAADRVALDAALRDLVAAIPDNHVELSGTGACPGTEGSVGVVLSDTDDDGVIVARVLDPSVGVAPGERVLEWGGRPIEEARQDAPTACLEEGIATTERLAFEQLRWLVRGEDGAEVQVVTSSGEHVWTALERDDDGFDAYESVSPCSAAVCDRIEGGVGIVSVTSEDALFAVSRMRRAMRRFADAGVSAVVLDLRGNTGGRDDTAVELAGFFTDAPDFYQHEASPDDAGVYGIDATYVVEPWPEAWTGPTAVLIDGFTVSSGEGLARAVSRRQDVFVVGFEGTAASFGFIGPSVAIGGRRIAYPYARSLDADLQILLDSDATGSGGVRPDHRVPWTSAHRIDQASGVDVVLREALARLRSSP